MKPRSFRLVADDYGFSPGVSRGIRALIEQGRLSGTGCMTLFPDWAEHVRDLRPVEHNAEIGLHLTLTDFMGLTGEKLPPLKKVIVGVTSGATRPEKIFRELDAQLDRFTSEIDRLPAYVDGHQHVHFLQPVRQWIIDRFAGVADDQKPWVRGAPTLKGAPAGIWPKISFVKGLAAGFERKITDAGLTVHGPLAGFYPWKQTGLFEKTMSGLASALPEGAVIMCHPGFVDDVLRSRDAFTDAREEELRFLASDAFASLMASTGTELVRPRS